MNTIDITVPQTVGVPLEPIVEAVRQALYSVSAPIDDVMENITSGGSLAQAVSDIIDDTDLSTAILRGLEEHRGVVKAFATEVVDETDFSTTFHEVLDEQFDIDDYREDVERMVETWFDYNFDIDNYSDDVQGMVETALSDRGWDDIDPSEFPTIADHDALTARVAELESRVERLVSALQNAVRAYSVDGGAQ